MLLFASSIVVTQSTEQIIKTLRERAAKIWEIDPEAVKWENGAAHPVSPNAGQFEPLTLAQLAAKAGPWPVSGAAIAIGAKALRDASWGAATTARLAAEITRIDALAAGAGWHVAGGAHLFRLYATPDASAARDALARHRIWSRIFPWSSGLIRLGLPGNEAEWQRLALALRR